MVIVGMIVVVITALPSIVGDALALYPGLASEFQSLYLVSIAFAVAVVGIAYSWANRETKKLFVEFKW